MDPSITVFIVDDNELDVERIIRTFSRLKITNPTVIAKDGIEALEKLRGTNGHQKVEQPYLILLDLNMPRMSGLEFLEELRKDDELKASVVIIQSTSDRKQDIESAYQHYVAGYIVKPIDSQQFVSTLDALDSYWSLNQHSEIE